MATRDSPASLPAAIFDPSALSITTVLTILFVVAAEFSVRWALAPLGVFVLFWAPGYAAVPLAFGRRPLPSIALNFALIVGFAVAINVILGTLLYAFAIAPLAPLIGLVDAMICTAATLVQYGRSRPPALAPGPGWFRSLFALPGFTSGQRVAAYALFVGILVTFGAIGYLSTLQPGAAPDLSFTVVGPDGTTGTLPTEGAVNATLTVLVEVQNNDTAQPFVLAVTSTLVGTNGSNFTMIPWTMPLLLSSNVTSSEPFNLTRGASESIEVEFEFSTRGDYAIAFSLTSPGSNVAVRSLSLGIEIT